VWTWHAPRSTVPLRRICFSAVSLRRGLIINDAIGAALDCCRWRRLGYCETRRLRFIRCMHLAERWPGNFLQAAHAAAQSCKLIE
jgi:hypothetical protein